MPTPIRQQQGRKGPALPLPSLWKQMNRTVRLLSLAVLAAALAALVITVSLAVTAPARKATVLAHATLEKVVDLSNLNTFSTAYEGVADVRNEKKPDETDYYVYYRAMVKSGVDFSQVAITVDHPAREIRVSMPPAVLTGISVDFASMEFLFMNSKANAATVSEAAYKACEADVRAECQNQQAILEFAARGAENVIRALLSPFLQQAGLDYTLIFTQEVTGL